ncbi:MAG: DNA polymerase III, partial [Candidatus Binatia bacterium]
YPDEVLKELDVVVVAVHSGFGQSRDRMTGRILDALDHPGVHILAHPTGRLLGARDPYEVDLERVLERAAERGVAVEVNGSYQRLDIGDVACRRALEMGCTISVNSDAHSPADLCQMRYAVAQARRGWVQRRHVLNCLTWPELKRWLGGKKSGK